MCCRRRWAKEAHLVALCYVKVNNTWKLNQLIGSATKEIERARVEEYGAIEHVIFTERSAQITPCEHTRIEQALKPCWRRGWTAGNCYCHSYCLLELEVGLEAPALVGRGRLCAASRAWTHVQRVAALEPRRVQTLARRLVHHRACLLQVHSYSYSRRSTHTALTIRVYLTRAWTRRADDWLIYHVVMSGMQINTVQ